MTDLLTISGNGLTPSAGLSPQAVAPRGSLGFLSRNESAMSVRLVSTNLANAGHALPVSRAVAALRISAIAAAVIGVASTILHRVTSANPSALNGAACRNGAARQRDLGQSQRGLRERSRCHRDGRSCDHDASAFCETIRRNIRTRPISQGGVIA